MQFDWWNTIQAREKLPMFIQCNDWMCSDRTLDVFYTVSDGVKVVWRVS